jgi:SAM-dependent methyltransferase
MAFSLISRAAKQKWYGAVVEGSETTPRWGSEPIDPQGFNIPALKARYIIDHLPHSGAVLEIGSGSGKFLRTLTVQRPRLRVHGCDIRDWEPPTPEIDFRLMDRDIPYPDATFDAVLVVDVLEHVDDPAHLLDEARRVLKPDGRFVGFVPIEGERHSLYALYRSLLGDDLYLRTKHHVSSFTFKELSNLLEARFELVDTSHAYHVLGHAMDATFFAAAYLPKLQKFWWRDNKYYAGDDAPQSPFVFVLNRLLELGNAVAYLESRVLAKHRLGVASLLFEARLPKPL